MKSKLPSNLIITLQVNGEFTVTSWITRPGTSFSIAFVGWLVGLLEQGLFLQGHLQHDRNHPVHKASTGCFEHNAC